MVDRYDDIIARVHGPSCKSVSYEDYAAMEAQRDALTARVEVLKKDIGTLSVLLGLRCREVDDYAAQVAALKEDAKRYRWLRDQDENSLYFIACGDTGTWGECGHSSVYGEYADSAIDAKREQKQ